MLVLRAPRALLRCSSSWRARLAPLARRSYCTEPPKPRVAGKAASSKDGGNASLLWAQLIAKRISEKGVALAGLVTLGGFVSLSTGLGNTISTVKEGKNFFAGPSIKRAAQAVLANTISCGTPPAELIERPTIVERVSHDLNSKFGGVGYTVVIGPRGGGKSTAVQAAAKNRDGTLSVTVTKDSDGSVYEVIAEAIRAAEFKAFGTESLRADGFTITSDEDLVLVMQKAAELRRKTTTTSGDGGDDDDPDDPSWIPTLIVEVEDQHATDEIVDNVATMLKRLCVDDRAVHGVLVLADEYAGFGLPNDRGRQTIVWVEDFSEVEAHAYLDKRHFLLADPKNQKDVEAKRARRQELFATVGTRAASLNNAVEVGEGQLAAHILSMQQTGATELASLLGVTTIKTPNGERKSDFQQLVRDMLKRDDGLPRSATEGYLPPNPAVVSKVFRVKGQHAVMYHMLTSTYQFHLPAHRLAAALWCQRPS